MKIKVPCHEANHICDKNQYKEATFWEKVKLNVHLIYCSACRSYSLKNGKLTKLVNKKEIQTVSLSEKEILEQRLQEQLNSSDF